MANMRDIKRRIKSVGSTQKITRAMNLVSASKLQRAKGNLVGTRPFFNETKRVIASIVNNSKGIKHPYLSEREVKNIAIIVLTSDRGLCGGYNSNISKAALAVVNKNNGNADLIIVGNKGKDFFKRRNKNIIHTVNGISEKPFYEDAAKIGKLALELFTSGKVDEVHLAYTIFQSTISHLPTVSKLLPVDTSEFKVEAAETNDLSLMDYEPNEEDVLSYVIPKYINTVIYGAMMESAACEQGARMTSMDSATENAGEMIDKYTLLYNRARQGAITQELTEIVSGANALE